MYRGSHVFAEQESGERNGDLHERDGHEGYPELSVGSPPGVSARLLGFDRSEHTAREVGHLRCARDAKRPSQPGCLVLERTTSGARGDVTFDDACREPGILSVETC